MSKYKDLTEIKNFEDLKQNVYFKRTVLSDIQIAKLCPGNDLGRIQEIMQSKDVTKQIDFLIKLMLILNEQYMKYCNVWDKEAERGVDLSEAILTTLTIEQISELSEVAFADFIGDGDAEVEAVAKKKEKEVVDLKK